MTHWPAVGRALRSAGTSLLVLLAAPSILVDLSPHSSSSLFMLVAATASSSPVEMAESSSTAGAKKTVGASTSPSAGGGVGASTTTSFHSSPLPNGPLHELYGDRPSDRPRPKHRSDLDPTSPIHPRRFVAYDDHPYDRMRRERERRRRTVTTRTSGGSKVAEDENAVATTMMVEEEDGWASLGDALDHEGEIKGGRTGRQDERRTYSSAYKPLRIHFDTTELESWATLSSANELRVKYLISQVLPGMAQRWSSALSVVRVSSPGLLIDHTWCPFADPFTSPSFKGDGVPDADLVIYVTANGSVCRGGGVYASAFSCYWDQFERPLAGNIDFCLETIEFGHLEEPKPESNGSGSNDNGGIEDPGRNRERTDDAEGGGGGAVVEEEEEEDAKDQQRRATKQELLRQQGHRRAVDEHDLMLQRAIGTAVHEFAHVLGVTSTDLLYFYDLRTGLPRTPVPQKKKVECVTPGDVREVWVPDETVLAEGRMDNGVRYYEVTTPTVRQVVRNQFDCQEMTGARLENQPTNNDCFGSHFDERLFFTENMSPVLGGVPEILSSLTLSLLHDSGWYEPDYRVAKVMPFGHGEGCDFVNKPCIDVATGTLPAFSEEHFCASEYRFEHGRFMGEFGCDPTHTHVAICDLVDYSLLSDKYKPPGPMYQYFPWNPNLGGLQDRGDFCPTFSVDAVSCRDVGTALDEQKLPVLDYSATTAETYGSKSRCFNTDAARPMCLEAECDGEDYVVKIKAGTDVNFITCFFDGQMHEIPGSSVKFKCPKINTICPDLVCPANCAGHGVCDYSASVNPECRCFDSTDTSSGCFNSVRTVPPQKGWTEALETDSAIVSNSASLMQVQIGWHWVWVAIVSAKVWLWN